MHHGSIWCGLKLLIFINYKPVLIYNHKLSIIHNCNFNRLFIVYLLLYSCIMVAFGVALK